MNPIPKNALNIVVNNDDNRPKRLQEINNDSAAMDGINSEFLKNCNVNSSEDGKNQESKRSWSHITRESLFEEEGEYDSPLYGQAMRVVNTVTVKPKNALELLIAVINFGRVLEKNMHILTKDYPKDRFVIDNSDFSFTLIPKNPTVLNALKITEPLEPKDWLQQNIINPSRKIKEYKLTLEKLTFLQNMAASQFIKYSLNYAYLKDKDKFISDFRKKVIYRNITDIHTVSQTILGLIFGANTQAIEPKKNYVTKILTHAFFQLILEPEITAELAKNVIMFADTNWVSKEQKNVYLAGYYNPVTDALEVGTINEDGSELYYDPQDKWVTDRTWNMNLLENIQEAAAANEELFGNIKNAAHTS